MKRSILIFLLPGVLHAESLTLKQAIDAALQNSYQIQTAALEQDALAGGSVQAAAYPNPFFSVDYGDVGFINSNNDEDKAISYEIEQLVELGGKRAARIGVADIEEQKAAIGYQLAVNDTVASIQLAYYGVSIAQEAYERARERSLVADKLLAQLDEMSKTGKISLQTYATLAQELREASFFADERLVDLEDAKAELLLLLGEDAPCEVSVDLLPSCIERPGCMCIDPCDVLAIQFQDLVVEGAYRMIELEDANATPDISLRAEIDQDHKGKHASFAVGATIELPIFNRNTGNRATAWAKWSQAEIERERFVRGYQKKIEIAKQRWALRAEQAERYLNTILKPAERGLQQLAERAKAGSIDTREFLTKELVHFEVLAQYRQYIYDALAAKIEYERLIGRCNG